MTYKKLGTGSILDPKGEGDENAKPCPDHNGMRALTATKRFLVIVAVVVGFGAVAAACSSGTSSSSTQAVTTVHHHGHHGHHGHHHGGISGVVSSVNATALVLNVKGTIHTIALISSTTYKQSGHSVSAASLQAGMRVRVLLVHPVASSTPQTSTPTARAVVLLPDKLAGTVTSLNSNGFSLRTPSGASDSVTTTSATTYRQGGKAATSSAVTVGARVVALVSAVSGSTTFTASEVLIK